MASAICGGVFCLLSIVFSHKTYADVGGGDRSTTEQSVSVDHNSQGLSSNRKDADDSISNFETTTKFNFDLLLGSFHMNSPVNTDDDIELFVIPKFSYYGDNFYFENTTLGYSLIENDDWTFDLLSQFNLDAVYFHTNNDELNTFLNFLSADTLVIIPFDPNIPFIEDRDYSYMAGFASSWHFAQDYDLNIKVTRDVTNLHQGMEADISISHFGGNETFGYSIAVGALVKDKKLSNYYFGLRETEVVIGSFPAYRIDSTTLSPYVKASFEKKLAEDWSLYLSYQSMSFDSKITDSILVVDEQVNTRFFGVKYRF